MVNTRTKKRKIQKTLMGVFIGVVCIFLCLFLWKAEADKHIYELPEYAKADLREILEKENLTEEDYRVLYMQTGLRRRQIEKLLAAGEQEAIYSIQQRFFTVPEVSCERNSIISWEEWTVREEDRIRFTELEDGDILITPCSHTFGWRNGHAAIVVNAEDGETLESVVLGKKSSVQSLRKWEKYPCVMVFRLKGVSGEVRGKIAESAKETMCGVDYGFDMGLLTPKYEEELSERTHCARLVWYAYRAFGYDLDSDGGRIVTPKDLAGSSLLEPVQVVGVNAATLWE